MTAHNIRYGLATAFMAVALFLAMLAFLEIGRVLGLRQLARFGEKALTGVGKADTPVYGLLALLLGFAFNGAASRFDHRRELIAQQVNALGTAWVRIDALPDSAQPRVRAAFRDYIDALVASYSGEGHAYTFEDTPSILRTRDELWRRSLSASLTPEGDKARMLLLPSLNEAFDVGETERLVRYIHPSMLIWGMLGITALASALFAGFGLSSAPTRSRLYMICIAAVVSSALFVTIELEYPRRGLVRVDEMALKELRSAMR
jgi:hypothetical protein